MARMSDAGVALEEIDAAIRGEQHCAADAGHHQPSPVRLGQILKIVDREIDLLLLGPFLANLRHSRVGAGHSMVPCILRQRRAGSKVRAGFVKF